MRDSRKTVGILAMLALSGSFASWAGDRCLVNVDGWDPGGHVVVTVDFDDGTGPSSATLVDVTYTVLVPVSDSSLAQLVWTYANSVHGWNAGPIGATTVQIASATGAEILGCEAVHSGPVTVLWAGVFDLPLSVIDFDTQSHDTLVMEPAVSSGGPMAFDVDGTPFTLSGAPILGQPDEAVRAVALGEIQAMLPSIQATALGNTAIVLESAAVSGCSSSDAEVRIGCAYTEAAASQQAPALSGVSQAVLIGLLLTGLTVVWHLRAGKVVG